LSKATLDLTSSFIATLEEDKIYLKNKMYASFHQIVAYINVELQNHPNELSIGAIMEKLMGSSMVRPICHIITFLLLMQKLNMLLSKD
jgi:hypothetical protein